MRPTTKTFIAGTVLSGTAVGLYGSLGPQAGFPHLTASAWHDWLALAGSAGISPLSAFTLSAVSYFMCFLAAGLRSRHRAPAPDLEPEPVQLQEVQPR